MRQEVASREQAEEEARVVINPLENRSNRRRAAANGTADFAVARKEGDGGFWYEVTGVKPERWVVQTNFDNDEAVGYLPTDSPSCVGGRAAPAGSEAG